MPSIGIPAKRCFLDGLLDGLILAHLLKDKAEASYARGTLLEKRARLTEDWSGYCDTPPATDAKVIQIREKQA
ncbi:hypothetical protein [Ferrovum myxofaciens]|uniref:hypothetical protein n=1 Tax=Ferrovum myxofaciens TaxID=416213 RepID=UPI00235296CD|nr:hypothetical protein [Ferrovum myxofaciens]MBU6995600.1 hypothetical protein [Ferrovum myxofaciens]